MHGSQAFEVTAEPAPVLLAGTLPQGAIAGWLGALVLAFLGGIMLNLMPCVLPVLSIKVMRFVAYARSSRRRLAYQGLLYGIGVLCSFAVLAVALLLLRAGGEAVGWGFQLQSPLMVALLAALMLLVGLHLSGGFVFGQRLAALGGAPAGTSPAAAGALFEGMLAVLVATPCTAPFMGTALGFAVLRPAWEAMSIFLALGFGFALPVMLLSLLPGWIRRLPAPGPWMETFKQFLAFPMYGAAAWLLWVLSRQTTAAMFGAALAALVLVALAAWLWGLARQGSRGAGVLAVLSVLLAAVLVFPAGSDRPLTRTLAAAETWAPGRAEALQAAGHPVLVNFTADWLHYLQGERETGAVWMQGCAPPLEQRGVAHLTADWTSRDDAIAAELAAWGRNGVPLYLLYPAGGGLPRILPQILTESIVLDAMDESAARTL